MSHLKLSRSFSKSVGGKGFRVGPRTRNAHQNEQMCNAGISGSDSLPPPTSRQGMKPVVHPTPNTLNVIYNRMEKGHLGCGGTNSIIYDPRSTYSNTSVPAAAMPSNHAALPPMEMERHKEKAEEPLEKPHFALVFQSIIAPKKIDRSEMRRNILDFYKQREDHNRNFDLE